MAEDIADLAHDVFGHERRPLEALFAPRTVAVIGATEAPGSVGRTVLANLLGTPFGGTVFPVNPKRPSVLGVQAWPSVQAVPAQVDLAVVVTPAQVVPGVIAACADAGVRAAIVISAGFKELGPPGVELERRTLEAARRGGLRLVGPNCLGVMNPLTGLNATFAKGMARPGNVAFLSQSGALLTSVLDWSFRELVGFSAIVSTGSMLDVGWGDLVDWFGDDPRTQSILVYMESVGDARAFLSAAREVALSKPIIVIKAGRTEAAARAAASHTGSLTGADEVLDAAFRRTGVLRVDSIAEVFDMAEVLSKQPRPAGPRLTIVTNAGGPAVLATDALILAGGELAPLSAETVAALDAFLPPHWSRANPVDILGDAGADRYERTLEIAAQDPHADGLLVVLTPQDMTDPTATAEALRRHARIPGKPVLASWMGGPDVAAGIEILNRADIPTFAFPDRAARAFHSMWRYSYNLRGLYETPAADDEAVDEPQDATGRAEAVIADVVAEGRVLLDEVESKRLLAAYGIDVTPIDVATDAETAAWLAGQLGYPVVVKLHSRTVTHKTDVGGVVLDVGSADDVRATFERIRASVERTVGAQHFAGVTVQPMVRLPDAYELIVGASPDPQFGPVLLFGSGGQLVEVYRDRALGLPPLNTTLATRMMEQTRIWKALGGIRGRAPVDREALAQLLVRFSRLVVEQRRIAEIEINPLLASPVGLMALDARVVLHPPTVADDALPRLAIRPYPTQYRTCFRTRDGADVTIRPIRPEDEPLLAGFHRTLSERSVRFRYFASLQLDQRVAHERLLRVCFNDYDRDLALVVEHRANRVRRIVAVGRLTRLRTRPGEAEFALVVSDDWHNRGLGTELLTQLVRIARDEGVHRLSASILPDNREMQRLCRRLGFAFEESDGVVRAVRMI